MKLPPKVPYLEMTESKQTLPADSEKPLTLADKKSIYTKLQIIISRCELYAEILEEILVEDENETEQNLSSSIKSYAIGYLDNKFQYDMTNLLQSCLNIELDIKKNKEKQTIQINNEEKEIEKEKIVGYGIKEINIIKEKFDEFFDKL